MSIAALGNGKSNSVGHDLFDQFFNNALEPIFIYNYDQEKFIDCNQAAVSRFGYSKKEFKSLKRIDLVWLDHPDMIKSGIDVTKVLRKQTKRINAGKTYKEVGIFKTKKGDAIFCETVGVPTNRLKGEAIISIKDNTALYFSNKKQRRINKELNLIQDQSPLAMVQFNLDSKVINCSKHARNLLGYHKEEIVGLHMSAFFSEKELARLATLIPSYVAGTKPNFEEFEVSKKNGEKILTRGLAKIVLDEAGLPMSVIVFFTDISLQKELEKSISARDFELNVLLENSPDRIIMLDNDNKIVRINQKAIEDIKLNIQSDLSHSEQPLEYAMYPNNKKLRNLLTNRLDQVKAGKTDAIVRPSILPDTLTKGYSKITYNPIYGSTGEVKGILIISRDITDIKNKEALLNSIIDSAPDSIFAIDRDYKLLAFNKKCQKDFEAIDGIQLKIGFDFKTGIPKKLFKDWKERVFDPVLKGKSFRTSVIHDYGDGLMYAENSYAPIENESNEIIGCVEIARDTTQAVLAEQEIRRSNQWIKELIKNSRYGIVVINLNGEVEIFNKRAEEHFHFYNVSLKRGIRFYDILPRGKKQKWQNKFDDAINTKLGKTYYTQRLENGKLHHFQISQNPMKNDKGELIGIMETFIDTTELVNAKNDAEQRENLLKTIINNIPDGLMVIDEDLKITKVNQVITQRVQHDFGVQIQENKTIADTFGDRMNMEILPNIKKAFKGKGQSFIQQYQYKNKIDYVQIDISKSPGLFNDKSSVILMTRDITEMVKKQNEIIASRKKFKDIFEHSHQAILLVDIEQNEIIDCNRNTLSLLGFRSKKALKQNKLIDFLATNQFEGKTKQQVIEFFKEEMVLKNKIGGKVNGITYLGKEFVAEITVLRENDLLSIFASDITQRHFAEIELAERTLIYETLIDNSFDGIDIIQIENAGKNGKGAKLVRRNERMKYFINHSDKTFLDPASLVKICPEIQPNGKKSTIYFNETRKRLLTKRYVANEWQLKNNRKLIDVIIKSQLLTANDKVLLVRFCQDITDIKRQEKTIQSQMSELDGKARQLEKYIESNLQLENFAYIASHDLKAPLRSVSSFAYLLKQNSYTDLSEKAKGFLDILISSAEHMQLLIDDLLLFSRMNTQKINLDQVDLNELVQRLLLDIDQELRVHNAGVTIINLPKQINVDRIKMKQLFQNLILNAAKFTLDGVKPEIQISAQEINGHYEIMVQDNGIGIKKEHLEKVFGIFEKLHSNDIYSGTGLGLTICKKIVDQHQGKIWVESDGQSGSKFYFTIAK